MRLMTPGPAACLPQVQQASMVPMIHHRTAEFQALYKDVVNGLRHVFDTEAGEIAILSGSGTTGLEAGIVNAFQKNDRVLIIDAGYFGERLYKMSMTFGLQAIRLHYDWKESYSIKDVEEAIAKYTDLKGILMVYSETSTGALNDIDAVSELIRGSDILLYVDCISGLVMNPFHFDAWQVDIAIAASQKGFFMSPGLAFLCLSPKAMRRIRMGGMEKYYLDLAIIIDKYHDEQKIGATPNVALLQGLRKALHIIQAQSMERWNAYYADLHAWLQEEMRVLGFFPYTKTILSRSLLVVECPAGRAMQIRNAIYEDSDIVIEVGLGAVSEHVLRIGTMNALTVFDCCELMHSLRKLKEQSII